MFWIHSECKSVLSMNEITKKPQLLNLKVNHCNMQINSVSETCKSLSLNSSFRRLTLNRESEHYITFQMRDYIQLCTISSSHLRALNSAEHFAQIDNIFIYELSLSQHCLFVQVKTIRMKVNNHNKVAEDWVL